MVYKTMTRRLRSALARLSDDDLMAEVKQLARCERDATAQLIAHLAELEELLAAASGSSRREVEERG